MPADATDKTVIWHSSDEAVASVDSSGLVTAVEKGTVDITATATNGISDSVTISVKAPVDPSGKLEIIQLSDGGGTLLLDVKRKQMRL